MAKASVLAGLDAQRRVTLQRLGKLSPAEWRQPTNSGLTVAELASWLAAVDEAAVRGRLGALGSPRPGVTSPGNSAADATPHLVSSASVAGVLARDDAAPNPATLLHRLERAGARLERGARLLPGVFWRTRVESDDGLRRTLVLLLRLRLLREWVAVSDPALGPPARPVPPVARELAQAALERLRTEVLPHAGISVGVIRLVLEEIPGQPGERMWGVDFARKHYGPRVEAAPDAVVRTWSGALARLLEGEVEASGLAPEELRVEGDRTLADAWLWAVVRGRPEGG